MDFQTKNNFGPRGPHGGDPKSPEPMSLDPNFFCGSNPLNKVPVSLPHPQKNIWGSNVVLFWNRESNFEAEILSPNGWVGSILLSFLHKITHSIY